MISKQQQYLMAVFLVSILVCAQALGDFNGDGHLDVVFGSQIDTNRVWLGDGNPDAMETNTRGVEIANGEA